MAVHQGEDLLEAEPGGKLLNDLGSEVGARIRVDLINLAICNEVGEEALRQGFSRLVGNRVDFAQFRE